MMTPTMMLLWIAGLEVISVPILIFTFNAMMIGYHKIKEEHRMRMIKALGETFEQVGKNIAMSQTQNKEDKHA